MHHPGVPAGAGLGQAGGHQAEAGEVIVAQVFGRHPGARDWAESDEGSLVGSRLVATTSSGQMTSVGTLASWVAGTSNQLTVTDDGDGSVTLSLPQNVHAAATPTFAGLTVSSASGLTVGATAGRVHLTPSFSPAEGVSAYGFYLQPTIICAGGPTYSNIFAGMYLAPPAITMNGGKVTDVNTLFIGGPPTGVVDDPGLTSVRSLYVFSGNSVIKDKLGVGAVTIPDAVLTVYGPGNTDFSAHIRTSNVPAPYGVWIEECSGGASGYPLLYITSNAVGTVWVRVDSGTGTMTLASSLAFATDNSVDLTAVGARPRDIRAGRTVYAETSVVLASGGLLSWSTDLHLVRDAAAVLAIKNGTNAQTLRVYGNTTGSKYAMVVHDNTNAIFGTSSGNITFTTTGATLTWSGAQLYALNDNSNDLGANGIAWRTLYIGTSIVANAVSIVTDTATGLKICTAANQKLGFHNATPIAQQTGVAVTEAAIHAALVNLGLITA